MAQRKGDADSSAEVLLCRDGVQPELLAAKLDALAPAARAALFSKKKNVVAVVTRLTEARARAVQSRASAAAPPRRAARRRCACGLVLLHMACKPAAEPRRGGCRQI